jgi:hypothetical protein
MRIEFLAAQAAIVRGLRLRKKAERLDTQVNNRDGHQAFLRALPLSPGDRAQPFPICDAMPGMPSAPDSA